MGRVVRRQKLTNMNSNLENVRDTILCIMHPRLNNVKCQSTATYLISVEHPRDRIHSSEETFWSLNKLGSRNAKYILHFTTGRSQGGQIASTYKYVQ